MVGLFKKPIYNHGAFKAPGGIRHSGRPYIHTQHANNNSIHTDANARNDDSYSDRPDFVPNPYSYNYRDSANSHTYFHAGWLTNSNSDRDASNSRACSDPHTNNSHLSRSGYPRAYIFCLSITEFSNDV